jgi:GH15 family glucan-1,4-alpha-glucosidase
MTQVPVRPRPSDQDIAGLAQSGFNLILRLQDGAGAYPATPTFSAYAGYSWFRDGAFIADGVSSYGGVDSASRFFDWCGRILVTRTPQINRIVAAAAAGSPVPDSEMLATRFTFAGEEGADEWWDFQLDGYGTWLWAVVEHGRRHGLDLSRWHRPIELTVDYLTSSWNRPCFDWWEENADQVHVSTLGCISAGLRAALQSGLLDSARRSAAEATDRDIQAALRDRGTVEGHLVKWLGSPEVDASLLALIAPLGAIPATSPVGRATIEAVASGLNVAGGVHRYRADTFYGGGQWPLLSCMLGLAFAAAGDRESALTQLAWAAGTVDADGLMPEQVGDHLLEPAMRQEWVERWGSVAQPLLWSHAMFLRLAVALDIVPVEAAR